MDLKNWPSDSEWSLFLVGVFLSLFQTKIRKSKIDFSLIKLYIYLVYLYSFQGVFRWVSKNKKPSNFNKIRGDYFWILTTNPKGKERKWYDYEEVHFFQFKLLIGWIIHFSFLNLDRSIVRQLLLCSLGLVFFIQSFLWGTIFVPFFLRN